MQNLLGRGAAVMNYMLTARFVFGQQATVQVFWRYFAASFIGLVINVGVTVGLIAVVSLTPILAKLTGTGVAFVRISL
jgi:putative flippase GtrA